LQSTPGRLAPIGRVRLPCMGSERRCGGASGQLCTFLPSWVVLVCFCGQLVRSVREDAYA
jgi:hypothetical protein